MKSNETLPRGKMPCTSTTSIHSQDSHILLLKAHRQIHIQNSLNTDCSFTNSQRAYSSADPTFHSQMNSHTTHTLKEVPQPPSKHQSTPHFYTLQLTKNIHREPTTPLSAAHLHHFTPKSAIITLQFQFVKLRPVQTFRVFCFYQKLLKA